MSRFVRLALSASMLGLVALPTAAHASTVEAGVVHTGVVHTRVVHTGVRLARVEDGKLELTSAFTGETSLAGDFDTVVLVYGSVPDTRLHDSLRESDSAARLFLAGSAWVPRLLAEATQHGARVGLEV